MIVIKRPSDGNWLVLSQAKTVMHTTCGTGLLAHMGEDTTMLIPGLTLESIEAIDLPANVNPPIVLIEREWRPFDSYLSPRDRAGEDSKPAVLDPPAGMEPELITVSPDDTPVLDGITDLIK